MKISDWRKEGCQNNNSHSKREERMRVFDKKVSEEEENWFLCTPEREFSNLSLTPSKPIVVEDENFSFFFTSDVHIGSLYFWSGSAVKEKEAFNIIYDNLLPSDQCVVVGGDCVHCVERDAQNRWVNFIDLFRKSKLCLNEKEGEEDEEEMEVPKIRTFFVAGNHDIDGGRDLYKKYVGSSFGHCTFHHKDEGKLLMIFVDTSWGMIGSYQFQEVEKMLESTRGKYEYIILVSHYSFVYDTEPKWVFLDVRERNKFERMLNKYQVDLVLSGHTHQYLSGFGNEHNEHSSRTTFHMTHGLYPRDLTGFRVHVEKECLKIDYFTLGKTGHQEAEVFQTIKLKKKKRE